MSEKWQQISLKLEGELAQALRDMKQSHEESVADVVIRLLKRVVRQSSPGPRVAPGGRSSAKAGAGRGAFGAGKRGKPMAPAAPAEYGGAAQGKRSTPRAAPAAGAWGTPRGKGKPAGARAPRRFVPAPEKAGTASRPPQLDGSGEPRRRDFRPRSDGPRSDGPRSDGPRSAGPRSAGPRSAGPRGHGPRTAGPRPMRPSNELGTAEDRPKGPRKAKRRPSGR